MSGRISVADAVAALGGIALFIAVEFLDTWYHRPAPFGAWRDQGIEGTVANYVMLIAAIAAIVTAILVVLKREAGGWRTIRLPLAVAGLAAVALRMVLLPETEIGGTQSSDYELTTGIFVALGGAVVLTIGAALGATGRGERSSGAPGRL